MSGIIEFADQLNGLIQENKDLHNRLDVMEKYLKMAICFQKGSLKYSTVGDANSEEFRWFLDNTLISYSGNSTGGIELVWKETTPQLYRGRMVEAMQIVTAEDIEAFLTRMNDG